MSWSYNEEIDEDEFEILLAKAKEESFRYHNEESLPQQPREHEKKHEDNRIMSSQFDGKAEPFLHEGIEAKGFHLSAGSTYIYPTNYPVRQYQASIVKTALFKNTLVSLPTGLGKTFIAAVVMYNFYRWYPCGKVVFMAPTRPLVAQQTKACHHIMNIPQEDTTEMTGAQSAEQRSALWKCKRVFYLTPQVMVNDLKTKTCPASLIKCVVIDEAHRATKDYAYCQVLKILSETDAVFRVLGLSATPGNDISSVQQVIQNLHIAALEMRSEDSLDVAPYTHSREITPVVVELSGNIRRVKDDLLQVFEKYARKLKDFKALSQNISNITKFQVFKACEKFRANPPRGVPPAMLGSLISDFTVCLSLAHSLELLQIYGLRAFYNYLSDDSGDKPKAASVRLRTDEHLKEMLRRLQTFLYPKPNENIPYNWSHPKLQKLVTCLTDHFKKEENKNATKAIIFCQYRVVVTEIVELLSKSKPLIRATEFIGQSGGKEKGMPQAKQIQIMKDFRNGIVNCLVATCVAEEGLDIGEVDLIILMETHKSPVRLVQRLGRTGRKRKGSCIILLTKGKEEMKYHDAMATRKSYIQNVVNAPAVKTSLCQNSPRMIPSECDPVQQLVHIHASNFESPARPAPKKQVDIRKCLSAQASNFPFSSDEDLMKALNELGGPELPFNNIPEHQELWHKIKGDKITVEELFSKSITSFSDWNEWNREEHEIYNIPHSSQTKLLCSLLNTPSQAPLSLYDLASDSGLVNSSKKEKETIKKHNISPKKKIKKNMGMDIRSCINLVIEKNETQDENEIIEILSDDCIDVSSNNNIEPKAKRPKISVPNNLTQPISCYEENNNFLNYLSKYMLPNKDSKKILSFKRALPDLDDFLSYVTHDILSSIRFNKKTCSQKSKSPVNNMEVSLLSSTAFEFDDLFADDSNSQKETSEINLNVIPSKGEKVGEIFTQEKINVSDKEEIVELKDANEQSQSFFDIDDILNGPIHSDVHFSVTDEKEIVTSEKGSQRGETQKGFKTLTDSFSALRKRTFKEDVGLDRNFCSSDDNIEFYKLNNCEEIVSPSKKCKTSTDSFVNAENKMDNLNKRLNIEADLSIFDENDVILTSKENQKEEITPAKDIDTSIGFRIDAQKKDFDQVQPNPVLNVPPENEVIHQKIEVKGKTSPAKGFKTLTSSFIKIQKKNLDFFKNCRENKSSQNSINCEPDSPSQTIQHKSKKESIRSVDVEKLPWFSDDDADFDKIEDIFPDNPNFCSTPVKSPSHISKNNQNHSEDVRSPLSMADFVAPSKMVCSTPLINSKTVKTFKKNKIIIKNIRKPDKRYDLPAIEEELINARHEDNLLSQSKVSTLTDALEKYEETIQATPQNSTMLGITQMVSLIEKEQKKKNLNPEEFIDKNVHTTSPKICEENNLSDFLNNDADLFHDLDSYKKSSSFNMTNIAKIDKSGILSQNLDASTEKDKEIVFQEKNMKVELEKDNNLDIGIELVDVDEFEDILPTQKYNLAESKDIPKFQENEFDTIEFNNKPLENELNTNKLMKSEAESISKINKNLITIEPENILGNKNSPEDTSSLEFIGDEKRNKYKSKKEQNGFEKQKNITLIDADEYEHCDGLLTQKYNIDEMNKNIVDSDDPQNSDTEFSEDQLIKQNVVVIKLKDDIDEVEANHQHLNTKTQEHNSLTLENDLKNNFVSSKIDSDITLIDIDFDSILTQKYNTKDIGNVEASNIKTCSDNSNWYSQKKNSAVNNIDNKGNQAENKSSVVEKEMINSLKSQQLSEPSQSIQHSEGVNFKKFSKKVLFPNKTVNATATTNTLTKANINQLEVPTYNNINIQNSETSLEIIHSKAAKSDLNTKSFTEPKARVALFQSKNEKNSNLVSDDSDDDIFQIPVCSKKPFINEGSSKKHSPNEFPHSVKKTGSEQLDYHKNHHSQANLLVPGKHRPSKAIKKIKKHNDLIETEADVSGELSSDDSDGSSLDKLDKSFIDDGTECFTQTMYLKSVKSPVGQGKFKIPSHINYADNVYSQHVLEEQSEYMNDSFCVGSDDETDESHDRSLSVLEIAERKLKGRKEERPTQKKRRRILNITSDDNSSTEKKRPSPLLAASEHILRAPVSKRRRRLLTDSESDESPLVKKKYSTDQPRGSSPSSSNSISCASYITKQNKFIDLTKSDSEEERYTKSESDQKSILTRHFNQCSKEKSSNKRRKDKNINDKIFELTMNFEKNLANIKKKYFGSSDDSSD